MVTVPEAVELPETPAEQVQGVIRSAIAGHPQGAVRRIALYVMVGIALGALSGGGVLPLLLGGAGLTALLLLVATDVAA